MRLKIYLLCALGCLTLTSCSKPPPPPAKKKTASKQVMPPPHGSVSKSAREYNKNFEPGTEIPNTKKDTVPQVVKPVRLLNDIVQDRQSILRDATAILRRMQTCVAEGQVAEQLALSTTLEDILKLQGGIQREAAAQSVQLTALGALEKRHQAWQAELQTLPEGKKFLSNQAKAKAPDFSLAVQKLTDSCALYYRAAESFRLHLVTNWREFSIQLGKRAIRRKEFEVSYKQAAMQLVLAKRGFDAASSNLEQITVSQ